MIGQDGMIMEKKRRGREMEQTCTGCEKGWTFTNKYENE